MSDRLIQKIFQSQYSRLAGSKQPLKNIKAIDALAHCRTPEMGSTYYQCEEKHKAIEIHHSCRNRSCYLCAQKSRIEWIDRQRDRLFNCSHFHVIFTLPHEYLALWRYNERFFSALLFRASQETLVSLMRDKKYHGVTPGIMTALHTWGRQLTLHPHVHCLVTAGGLAADDRWKSSGDFLLPIRVVKARYRGIVQSALKEALEVGELSLPPDSNEESVKALLRATWKKAWSVRIEEQYSHGKGVMLYLSRYLKGGPLNPHQIESVTSSEIRFRYLDHRDKRKKILRLSLDEFMTRLLTHVPHVGLHTFRYYGLYAPAAKRRRLIALRGVRGTLKLSDSRTINDVVLSCMICGGLARRTYSRWRNDVSKANSFNKKIQRVTCSAPVQQVDEAVRVGESYDDST